VGFFFFFLAGITVFCSWRTCLRTTGFGSRVALLRAASEGFPFGIIGVLSSFHGCHGAQSSGDPSKKPGDPSPNECEVPVHVIGALDLVDCVATSSEEEHASREVQEARGEASLRAVVDSSSRA